MICAPFHYICGRRGGTTPCMSWDVDNWPKVWLPMRVIGVSHAGWWRNRKVGDSQEREGDSKEQGGRDEGSGFWKRKKKRIAEERQEGCIVDFPARCGMFSFPSTYCFTFYWTMSMVSLFAVAVKGHRVAFGWAFSFA